MKNSKYDSIADRYKVKPKKNNLLIAFISGGILGSIAEILIEIFCMFNMSRNNSATLMIVIFIIVASILTGFGVFDNLVSKLKCGLLIPITGFSHSMTSSAMDYKNEGLVLGIGSNMFKLAGSVIVYGVLSSWLFGMIRYLIGGIG